MKQVIGFFAALVVASCAMAGEVDSIIFDTADWGTSVTNGASAATPTMVTSRQSDGYVEAVSLRMIQGLGVITATSKVVIATVTNSFNPVSVVLYSNLTFTGTDRIEPVVLKSAISGTTATSQWGKVFLSADQVRITAWGCNAASNTSIKASVDTWR